MRSTPRRSAGVLLTVLGLASGRYLNAQVLNALKIAAMSGGLIWLVWVYGNGLRDARYLDGWLLAIGMGFQIAFHLAIKTASLPPKFAVRWRKLHIFVGYLLIAAFISHSDFSLPDTGLEWALWLGFVLVTVSGIFGTYLAWALKCKHAIDEGISYDRIPARCAELANDVHSAVTQADPAAGAIALPAPPHDAWIMDLYTSHLRSFFEEQQNFSTHLIGSQRPLKRLTDEIDNLARYVDQRGQDKLAIIRDLVVEKYRLDFARVILGLTKGWLFVHVPVTYSLIVLMVLHIFVVYAYSSGPW